MKDVLYCLELDDNTKDGYTSLAFPNGKKIQVLTEHIEKVVPVTSHKDGIKAYYLKAGALISIEVKADEAALGLYADEPTNSFPKYYDDDGGTPLKTYDDPLAAPETFPKFYDDDGGTPYKSRDDGYFTPSGPQPSPDLRLTRSGARKRIEDTAFWPSW